MKRKGKTCVHPFSNPEAALAERRHGNEALNSPSPEGTASLTSPPAAVEQPNKRGTNFAIEMRDRKKRKAPINRCSPIRTTTTSPDSLPRARFHLEPRWQAAMTLCGYDRNLKMSNVAALLTINSKALQDGDLSACESMLLTQAHTLDVLFNNLVRRSNRSDLMAHMETYMRLALKAQNQCRTTLETLAMIKNPPVAAFVRQQNVAVNQQVNGGEATSSRAGSHKEKPTNELLEYNNGKRLDAVQAGTTFAEYSTLGALDEVNGAEVGNRQEISEP